MTERKLPATMALMEYRYKFFPESGSVQLWKGRQYIDQLIVVAVVPTGEETLVVLARAPSRKKPEGWVEVLKVDRFHRWNALRSLAHAMCRADWNSTRRYLLDGCPEPRITRQLQS